MARKTRREPEKPKVERVDIVHRATGAFCTVGSDVVEKYLSRKGGFRKYDPVKDARPDDDYDEVDDESELEETPAPPAPPAKKAVPAKA